MGCIGGLLEKDVRSVIPADGPKQSKINIAPYLPTLRNATANKDIEQSSHPIYPISLKIIQGGILLIKYKFNTILKNLLFKIIS